MNFVVKRKFILNNMYFKKHMNTTKDDLTE